MIRHVVEDVFGGVIATPPEYADAVADELRRRGISADAFPPEALRER